MINQIDRNKVRQRRHLRVRKHIIGTPERPRLNVFRSNANIYAQIIVDVEGDNQKVVGNTLVSASTLDKAIAADLANGSNVEAAKAVGKLIAERALEKGIDTVVFDRGGYPYHGRVAALADAAREAGLKF